MFKTTWLKETPLESLFLELHRLADQIKKNKKDLELLHCYQTGYNQILNEIIVRAREHE